MCSGGKGRVLSWHSINHIPQAEFTLIGVYRFPYDTELTALEEPASAVFLKSPFSIERIMFGKWRSP